MCGALANPLYLSDSPQFLLRQRRQAARALVSEHVGSVTCPCLKCQDAARAASRTSDRAGGIGPLSPQPSPGGSPLHHEEARRLGSGSTDRPGASVAESLVGGFAEGAAPPRRALSRPSGVPLLVEGGDSRDFVWLLRVIFDTAEASSGQSAGSTQPPSPKVLSTLSRTGARTLLAGARESSEPPPGAPEPLSSLGVRIPETVVLEKGKPRKRYMQDPQGRLAVSRMKTSAELLRVLRDFVRRAHSHHRGPRPLPGAAGEALRRPARRGTVRSLSTGNLSQPRSGPAPPPALPRQNSAPSAPPAAPLAPAGLGALVDIGPAVVAAPMHEVAVLYYQDGGSRAMTGFEALVQMNGASKLPREFWQHIRMLQVPVQGAKGSLTPRFITYNFDARSQGTGPQAPSLLARRRSDTALAAFTSEPLRPTPDLAHEDETARVSAVPRWINECLRAKRKGEVGVGSLLVRGQFEFVRDGEGTLWLVNATRLACVRRPREEPEERSPSPEEVRYFREEEFESVVRAQEERFERLKRRWGEPRPPAAEPLSPLGSAHSPTFSEGSRHWDLDSMPQELVKFYEAESQMARIYDEVIRPEVLAVNPAARLLDTSSRPLALAHSAARLLDATGHSLGSHTGEWSLCGSREGSPRRGRAVGLSVWFRRWVRSHRGRAGRPRGTLPAAREGPRDP